VFNAILLDKNVKKSVEIWQILKNLIEKLSNNKIKMKINEKKKNLWLL
jgi:hypothetical protein